MDLKQTSSSVTSAVVKEFLTKAQSSHMIPHYTKEEKKYVQLTMSKVQSKPVQHSLNLKKKATETLQVQSDAFSSSLNVNEDVTPEKLFFEAIIGDDGQLQLRQAYPKSE